jgi:hypothetical protein
MFWWAKTEVVRAANSSFMMEVFMIMIWWLVLVVGMVVGVDGWST